MPNKKIIIALAGNPNSGKTTIFNNLTGARQKVGNWGGVTVEKKEGTLKSDDYEINIMDLPGTYSLTAYSIEEIVARNYIIDEKPDIIVNIIDSSNLERNLYLTTQLIDLGVPIVIALNMYDELEAKGIKIDIKTMSRILGIPIIPTIGKHNKGTKELIEGIIKVYEQKEPVSRHTHINYGEEIEREIHKIQKEIHKELSEKYSTRWLSLKLLEKDKEIEKTISDNSNIENILKQTQKSISHIEEIFKEDTETIIADRRYGWISGACRECVSLSQKERIDISAQIDKVLTNRLLGFPIFILFIWLLFQSTFTIGAIPMEWIDIFVGWLSESLTTILPEGLFRDLLVDGVIGGVGGVIIFLPNILILFLGISILEDTGYMARAAFIMDKVMHTLGLHGKAFIPMIMGFGCKVPAIMAT